MWGRHPPSVLRQVPAFPADICKHLRTQADEVICAITPESFRAIGDWYAEYEEISDEEVTDLLARAKAAYRAPKGATVRDRLWDS